MNTYIAPYDFKGLVVYEDEHPIVEREERSGRRNVVVFHTAGKSDELTQLSETTEIPSDIYTFTTITNQEDPLSWDNTYQQVIDSITESGQTQGVFVATATTSDQDNNGF